MTNSRTRFAVLCQVALLGFALSGLAPASAAELVRKRVVAAGGIITEIVHALGREDWLVGIDTTSLYPPEILKRLPNVGYVRALSAEGVLSLRPDLVIALESAGPPDALRLLTEAKVEVRRIGEDYSAMGIANRIRVVGELVSAPESAARLADAVETRFAELAEARGKIVARKRVLFVLSLQNGRVMAGGRNTSADAIIALAGGVNAAEAIEGFKPISDEGLIAAAPDVIVMMRRGEQEAPSAAEVFSLPAFKAVPAARERALVVMDGLYLLGFGPRTPDAASDLMRAIYARKEGAVP